MSFISNDAHGVLALRHVSELDGSGETLVPLLKKIVLEVDKAITCALGE